MPGIFGNTAEDRFHANDLDNYLDSLMDGFEEIEVEQEECHNCGEAFKNDFEIYPFEMHNYCRDCYDSVSEDATNG